MEVKLDRLLVAAQDGKKLVHLRLQIIVACNMLVIEMHIIFKGNTFNQKDNLGLPPKPGLLSSSLARQARAAE